LKLRTFELLHLIDTKLSFNAIETMDTWEIQKSIAMALKHKFRHTQGPVKSSILFGGTCPHLRRFVFTHSTSPSQSDDRHFGGNRHYDVFPFYLPFGRFSISFFIQKNQRPRADTRGLSRILE